MFCAEIRARASLPISLSVVLFLRVTCSVPANTSRIDSASPTGCIEISLDSDSGLSLQACWRAGARYEASRATVLYATQLPALLSGGEGAFARLLSPT